MTILQLLIALVLGVGAGFGTHALCPADASGLYSIIAGLAVSGVSLFALTRRGRSSSSTANTLLRPASKPATGARTTTKGERLIATDRSGSLPTPVRSSLAQRYGGTIEATVDTTDGTTKVVVIASGFSSSDFKTRVLPAIQKVGGAKWDIRNNNLKDGRRRVIGTVSGSADRVVAAVKSL